ncbi:MAG: TlyA family RNA methyltransferase [Candidatus Lokiarchaeota archaeon]|nr:TlyA family RNA methyltransferase [Candidatus Lokiarchaeota archaeon]
MKKRIDFILVEKNLVESRTKAQWLIKNGYVFINGKKVIKPGKLVDINQEIQLKKNFPYVSRGGIKLEAALNIFSISPKGKTCADIGSSVGGFTDCLLKHGASRVYAIDTAIDLLHPSLKKEKIKDKIISISDLDARNLIPIKEKLDICTIDVTFASLRTILPNVKRVLKEDGDIIALVKPIFETEFHKEDKFDVIQDPNQLFEILKNLIQWNRENQIFTLGIIKSPILGKEGSLEFLIHLKLKKHTASFNFIKMIKDIVK